MERLVALKSFVGKVKEATEDGSVLMFDHEVYYSKGDYIFTNLKGEQQVIPKSRYDESLYMEIKEIKRVNKRYTYDEIVSGYKEMTEQEEDSSKLMFDTEHYAPHSE